MAIEHGSESARDLRAGIPLSELSEGEPLTGQVDGSAVVVVRVGDEVHAIGGTCTHYGGPLGEGLVVGTTIRCPWHHACFSLRTGEAMGAPALAPVGCHRVEIRNGVVYVGDAVEPAARGRSTESAPGSVLIVGAGAAGSAAADMLRREGYAGRITMVDPDADAPYDRPNLSKDYLAGEAPEEWIPLHPAGFEREPAIERVIAAVEALEPTERRVRLATGEALDYGALVLATGSDPVRLDVPGADGPNVHVLRTLGDCRSIIAAAEGARRAVVVGASFIGMEVAASLRSRELEVTVVAPDAVPFERTFGEALGRMFRAVHEDHGVTFRLGTTVTGIRSDGVRLASGEDLAADLVVVGIGVRPRTALAEAAGLEVDDGVIVDGRLETSAPGVYAAGDIARYPDHRTGERIRVEHWVAAQRQGQAVARAILGERRPFSDPPFFWTRQWEFGVSYVGYGAGWDGVDIDGDPAEGDAAIRYYRGDRVAAVATIGRDLESLAVEREMERSSPGDAVVAGGETR